MKIGMKSNPDLIVALDLVGEEDDSPSIEEYIEEFI
jgi:hypothetical protein